jgi:hypothetical protein
MLSFELSVIDIVLVIAIIVILLLYAMKTPAKNVVEQKLLHGKEKPSEESKTRVTMPKTSKRKEPVDESPGENSVKCPHHLGYLKTLPLGSTVPEECYVCPQMMRCLFSSE